MIFHISVNQREYRVELERQEDGRWTSQVNGERIVLDSANTASGVLSLLIGDRSLEVIAGKTSEQITVDGVRYAIEVHDPRAWRTSRARTGASDGPKRIVAPMPGKVVRVLASAGSQVEMGAGIVVIEAMKMQNELKSPRKGRVTSVPAIEGALVNAGDVLAVIE